MKRYTADILSEITGLSLIGASLDVLVTGTETRVTLYAADDDGGATVAQPVPNGVAFYVPDGRYDLRAKANGRTRLIPTVDMFDGFEQNRRLEAVENGEPGSLGSLRSDLLASAKGAGIVGYEGGTVQSKLLEGVSVAEVRFAGGAKGDGNDDLPAIQAAYDWAKSQPYGAEIFFPAAFYTITDTLRVDHENKHIHFVGPGAFVSAIRLSSSTSKPTILVGGTANYYSDEFEMRGIMIGPTTGTGADGPEDTLIEINNRGGVILEDLIFNNGRTGLNLKFAAFSTIVQRCKFNGTRANAVVTSPGDQSANHFVLENCRFYNCGRTASAVAIQINAGYEISIVGNTVEGCYNGIFLNGCKSVTIERNYIENSNANFYIQKAFNVTVCGNWFGDAVAPMIIENVTGLSFEYNSIYNLAIGFGETARDIRLGLNTIESDGVKPSYITEPSLNSVVSFRRANRNYAAAPPSTGMWMQGEVIFNTLPVAGSSVGWVCVAAGTPGSWKSFGTIAA